MENKILDQLNLVAKEYTTSRNLIKNINKRYSNEFKIISCEPSGTNYRLVKVMTNDNKEFKYKLCEFENSVEFKLFSDKADYNLKDVCDILKTGDIKILPDSITITLDDLSFNDYDIMMKVLGRR